MHRDPGTPHSLTPTRKVTAATAASALVIVGVWVAGLLGASIPSDVAAALQVVATFVAGWTVTDR